MTVRASQSAAQNSPSDKSPPKRDNSEIAADAAMGTECDSVDLACAASLLVLEHPAPSAARVGRPSESKVLCQGYPLTDHEPLPLELGEEAKKALASGKEDTDPLDYGKASHELLATPIAHYATDESSARELAAQQALANAQAAQYVLGQKHNGHGNADPEPWFAGQARIAEAERAVQLAAQSCALRAKRVGVVFDAGDNTYTVTSEYLNETGVPMSVVVGLPRTKGLTLTDVDVDLHGYTNTSAYRPIEQAKQIFAEAQASTTKSASIQAMDKSMHTITVKVPAFAPSTDRTFCGFTARFKLACDDAEAKAQLLPAKAGQPAMEACDFAVQPPAQDASGPIPFELRILPSGTSALALPSRAAASLDAARRGVPTYWVKPSPECEDVDGHGAIPGYRIKFSTPSLQPPCLRFRFVNESDDCDAVADAMKNASLKSDVATAEVLCFAPANAHEGVALVRVKAPTCVADPSNVPGNAKHIVLVVDESGSMQSCVGGDLETNRTKAKREATRICEKLHDLPRIFAESKITSKNDKFFLTIVGFHSTASVVASRVPIVSGCEESKRALDAAAAALSARTETGGTQYTSWAAALLALKLEGDVALALLTDGQLWDQGTFVPEYAKLKESVEAFEACAIGCGAWANHATVKIIATGGGGETLVERIDATVSSEATRLIGKCVATMATKYTVVVEDAVIAHKGPAADAPTFVDNPRCARGRDTVYRVGLGGDRIFAVGCSYNTTTVLLPKIAQVDAPEFSYKVEVQNTNVPIDVMRVLRHIDPLFAGEDVEIYKCPQFPKFLDGLREGIGVHNQTTTSNVVKVAEYELGNLHDHSLDPRTKATLPQRSPLHSDEPSLPWMRRVPSLSNRPKVVTDYERAPHIASSFADRWECNALGEPAFRSLGAGDDKAAPRYRSCSGGEDAPMAEAPAALPKGTKGEVEKPTDDNATPTFAEASKRDHHDAMLGFLNDHTFAHCAVEDLIKELRKMLASLKAQQKTKASDPMEDIVGAALDKVAGPSPADLTTATWPLLSALCALAMRYHLPMDINLHNDPIAEGNVDAAIRRTEYLLKIAAPLHEKLLPFRIPFWRAKLVAGPVESGQSFVKASVEWAAEDCPSCGDCVEEVASLALAKLARVYCNCFNSGGYLGGTFASEGALFKGATPPPDLVEQVFHFALPFVRGESYAPFANIYAKMEPVLAARA